MAFSNSYIISFAAGVCVVCSLAVASTATGLKERQDLNKQRDLRNNILQALSLVEEGVKPPGEQIDKLWGERVEIKFVRPDGSPVADGDASADIDIDGDGDLDIEDVEAARAAAKGTDQPPAVLGVYARLDDAGKPSAYALPMFGSGLWGPLSAYIAVDTKGSEILGVTFFAPKETPGLGAEIQEPPFKQQWKGKSLVGDAGESVPVRVAKGDAESLYPSDAEHWVDGVSGATITCRGVTAMLEEGVALYDPFLSKLRKGG